VLFQLALLWKELCTSTCSIIAGSVRLSKLHSGLCLHFSWPQPWYCLLLAVVVLIGKCLLWVGVRLARFLSSGLQPSRKLPSVNR